jgi:hypothetical protein
MLYGLEVIDANTKEKIKFGKALVRSLSYIISSIVFSLGFLWVAIDKEKHRGWHDKIAKTLVIRKKRKSLILPVILSIIAICFVLWIAYFGEQGYDFSYLGREAAIIDSIQQQISYQPEGFCCSYMSPYEIGYYLEDIPQKLYFQGKRNAEQIFEEFSEATVTIGGETSYGEFGFGSGFLISPSGLLVTNYHVIEDMDKLAVALKRAKIQVFDANLIIVEDAVKDIAILKIEGKDLPHITIGDSDLVKTGQRVFAIGNPEGFTNTISEGIISQFREFEEGITSFQITAPISIGSSGGALFNETGEVIGITNSMFLWGQNINFAIPINYVKDLLGLGQDISEFRPEEFSQEKWEDFYSPLGEFRARFPTYPIFETEDLTLPYPYNDLVGTYDTYFSEQPDGTAFMVGVATYPPEIDVTNSDYFLEDTVVGIVESDPSNKLLLSESTTFSGYKARDFLIKNDDLNFYMKGKLIIVGQTLYELMMGYEVQNYRESDYNYFIDSFKLAK